MAGGSVSCGRSDGNGDGVRTWQPGLPGSKHPDKYSVVAVVLVRALTTSVGGTRLTLVLPGSIEGPPDRHVAIPGYCLT